MRDSDEDGDHDSLAVAEAEGESIQLDDTRDGIAEPIYHLISEVFELRGVFGWLRRTLVTFVQITYGGTINRYFNVRAEYYLRPTEPQLSPVTTWCKIGSSNYIPNLIKFSYYVWGLFLSYYMKGATNSILLKLPLMNRLHLDCEVHSTYLLFFALRYLCGPKFAFSITPNGSANGFLYIMVNVSRCVWSFDLLFCPIFVRQLRDVVSSLFTEQMVLSFFQTLVNTWWPDGRLIMSSPERSPLEENQTRWY